jgi:hypothetical protein
MPQGLTKFTGEADYGVPTPQTQGLRVEKTYKYIAKKPPGSFG